LDFPDEKNIYGVIDDIQERLMKHGFIGKNIRTFINDNFTFGSIKSYFRIFGIFAMVCAVCNLSSSISLCLARLNWSTSCIISAILSISSMMELILFYFYPNHP
jgi:hypothetical protein